MKIDDKTIEEFRRLYFEDFREEISKQEAYDKFLRLVNLMRVVYRPDLVEPCNEEFLKNES